MSSLTSPHYDVIIIGGSYAGLSAAMALGRSLRKVLVIDSGKPCNRQTPHAHNIITHDGDTPASITAEAKKQVLKYDTVQFITGMVTDAEKTPSGFQVTTDSNTSFTARKILFATGLSDKMPAIEGYAECWGISVLHCPYCHGYEVRSETIGLIANGDTAFELARLISNWSKSLTLFTNGASQLTTAQALKLEQHNIKTDEREILRLNHTVGKIKSNVLADETEVEVTAVFSRPAFAQHSHLPARLGCTLTEHGFISVNDFCQTSVLGVYAAGDNSTMLRSVSNATASGNKAGAVINKELIDEEF